MELVTLIILGLLVCALFTVIPQIEYEWEERENKLYDLPIHYRHFE